MRIWSYPIDFQSVGKVAITKTLVMLLFDVAFELLQFTFPVTLTVGTLTQGGATKFYCDIGDRDE